MERPEGLKLSHDEVRYVNPSKKEEHCAICKHFIKANPPRCEGVASPIDPKAWCVRYTKMPFVSKAQQGYFNANRKKLEAQGVDVDEWNSASKGLKLPKKKSTMQRAVERTKRT
jgi:hypothetical protein